MPVLDSTSGPNTSSLAETPRSGLAVPAKYWVPVAITFVTGGSLALVFLVQSQSSHKHTFAPATRTTTTHNRTARDLKIEKRVLELLSAGEQSKAEDLLDTALKDHPHAVKFVQFSAQGKTKEADRYLKAHRQRLGASQRTLFLFATCQRSRFDTTVSFEVFKAVADIDPDSPDGQCATIVVRLDSLLQRFASQGQIDKSFTELAALADANPKDVMIRWMLAVECRTYHRNAEGTACYKQILGQWKPGPALVHQTYANLLDNLGRYQESLIHRRQVVKMEPAAWSYDGLGNTLDSLDRYQEAYAAHELAVKLNPQSSSHWSNWACNLNGSKKYDQAREKAQRALDLDATNWRAWWMMGNALHGQGHSQQAFNHYKKALAIMPDHEPLQNQARELEAKLGK